MHIDSAISSFLLLFETAQKQKKVLEIFRCLTPVFKDDYILTYTRSSSDGKFSKDQLLLSLLCDLINAVMFYVQTDSCRKQAFHRIYLISIFRFAWYQSLLFSPAPMTGPALAGFDERASGPSLFQFMGVCETSDARRAVSPAFVPPCVRVNLCKRREVFIKCGNRFHKIDANLLKIHHWAELNTGKC